MTPTPIEAKPILKWAGGKRQLEAPILKHILKVYPKGFADYYEPFCGGAAVFFALRSRGLIHGRAHLSDMNGELIDMYQAVRDDVDGVLKDLKKLCRLQAPGDPLRSADEIRYYAIRGAAPRSKTARAARMIYLNKNGYNGLYRVNSSGGFNVPWGKRETFTPEEDEIRAASRALQGVQLLCVDFSAARSIGLGVFHYFDPPYIPASDSADFTSYTKAGFGISEQERLARLVLNLNRRGEPFLLSNSDTKISRALYKGLTVKTVQATRRVNSVGSGRGTVPELLVSNKKGPR